MTPRVLDLMPLSRYLRTRNNCDRLSDHLLCARRSRLPSSWLRLRKPFIYFVGLGVRNGVIPLVPSLASPAITVKVMFGEGHLR
jgi:hypothetical protein